MGRASSLKARKNLLDRSAASLSAPSAAASMESRSFSKPPRSFSLNLGRRPLPYVALLLLSVVLLIYFAFAATFSAPSPEIYSFELVHEFPHDPKAFTQGLLYAGNDTLYESTGLYKESTVRLVQLQTGKVLALHKMDNSYFGEGLTVLGERLFQVTWQEKTGFIYDRQNLSELTMFTHDMRDGWGLATDGKVIFGSDGTSTLYQLDPKSLKVLKKVIVKYKEHEVFYLNELEYINGEVWANVWQTDCIARISHKDGKVLGWIVLQKLREGLIASGKATIDVLNGIAWDKERNRLFVTGKLWPKLYEIKIHPVKGPSQGVIEKVCLPRSLHGGVVR